MTNPDAKEDIQVYRCARCVDDNPTGKTAYTFKNLEQHEHGTDYAWSIDKVVA